MRAEPIETHPVFSTRKPDGNRVTDPLNSGVHPIHPSTYRTDADTAVMFRKMQLKILRKKPV